jgi:hypothetical protein
MFADDNQTTIRFVHTKNICVYKIKASIPNICAYKKYSKNHLLNIIVAGIQHFCRHKVNGPAYSPITWNWLLDANRRKIRASFENTTKKWASSARKLCYNEKEVSAKQRVTCSKAAKSSSFARVGVILNESIE